MWCELVITLEGYRASQRHKYRLSCRKIEHIFTLHCDIGNYCIPLGQLAIRNVSRPLSFPISNWGLGHMTSNDYQQNQIKHLTPI